MKFKEIKTRNKVAIMFYLIAGVLNIILGIKTVNMFQILLGVMFFTYILDVYTTELSEKNQETLWNTILRQEEIIENQNEFLKKYTKIPGIPVANIKIKNNGNKIKIPEIKIPEIKIPKMKPGGIMKDNRK